jgi:hypothetical protein
MEERRKEERCVHCNGNSMTWGDGSVLRKICLICGRDFEARREDDLHKFKREARKWQ